MENNVNFDALAQKFFAARGEETYCDLFSAVFALPEWHFIADGEFPNLSPYCVVLPDTFAGQPMVLAFTDKERLNKYVVSQNLNTGSADKPITLNSPDASVKFSSENLVLSIPTTSVIDYLERLTAKGVKGVFFNPNRDSEGFHLGLPQLRETKELVDSKKPKIEAVKIDELAAPIDFDALSRKSNESGGAMTDLNNIFGATFALEKWIFIARGSLPNINPYIAANADYAGGQQMIRAFTDSDRLQRFARENNLTGADGSAQMLEIPTGGIVEYLEQFVQYGVHGVWFNSDTKSDGYFIPLAQLRPIKEHLAKIGWQSIDTPTNPDLPPNSGFVPAADSPSSAARNTPLEAVTIVIKDGLMLPSGLAKASTYACNFYCLVPPAWTENGKLRAVYLEKFYEHFYGANWKNGNSDGSHYIVESAFSNVLTPEYMKQLDWTEEFGWNFQNDDQQHYWHFIAAENGEIVKVAPPEFQKAYNLARRTAEMPKSAVAPPKTSNLEDFGFSPTPDGETDLRIRIFKTGSVKPGSSLVPLYSAFAPLLFDYQGSGKYEKIFNFAPEAVSNDKESFVANTHGNYFRMRTFQYASPSDVADAMTIDSNRLRHIKTGATLLVSFALLNVPSNSSAALYFSFEGGSSEVQKLLNAVAPALENAGFVEAETK